MASPTRLSSLEGKEKDVSNNKKFSLYIAPLRPKTRRRLKDRELNQARSKPDTVNRPVRPAHIFVTIIIVHNTVTQRQFYLYSPSSRPTSHLRCGQLEVRGERSSVKPMYRGSLLNSRPYNTVVLSKTMSTLAVISLIFLGSTYTWVSHFGRYFSHKDVGSTYVRISLYSSLYGTFCMLHSAVLFVLTDDHFTRSLGIARRK